MSDTREWPKARFAHNKKVDRKILGYFQKHDALSTLEIRELLVKDGLGCRSYHERIPGRLSSLAVDKRVSNMRVCGLLYYTMEPGNRLRMTVHGEAMLAVMLLKEDQDGKDGVCVQGGEELVGDADPSSVCGGVHPRGAG